MKVHKIIILILLSGLLVSCHDKMYRTVIPSSRRQIKMNPYGAYTQLVTNTKGTITGEALAISDDTLYLLGATSVEKISTQNINQAKLILTRNRAENFLSVTSLLTIPSILGIGVQPEYSAGFAVMALLTFGTGGIASSIESRRTGEIKSYPEDIKEVSTISNYCRFPKGIPAGFNIETLEGHMVY